MYKKNAKHRWNRRSNRAFTLVELLVVISIIALLLSILMPALNKVRQQGISMQCATKMRQIGLGMSAYSVDFRDSMPYAVDFTSTNGWLMAIPQATIPNYYNTYLDPWVLGSSNKGKAYKGPKWTGNNSIYLCPAQVGETNFKKKYGLSNVVTSVGTYTPDQQRSMLSSYAYNYDIGFGRKGLTLPWIPPLKSASVKPSTIILIENWPAGQFFYGYNSSSGGPVSQTWPTCGAWRHSSRMNVVFADNHVERKLKNDLAMNDTQGYIWGNGNKPPR